MTKDLSIIIASYNTASLTISCLKNLYASFKKYPGISFEVIIVDNGSSDKTVAMIENFRKKNKNIIFVKNKKNLGYSKANNQGLKRASGEFVLFLNSDVLVKKGDWLQLLAILRKNEKIGALTPRINLKNGQIDLASHRGFPTLWRSFCYFSGLEKIFWSFPLLNRVFGGYHLAHLDFNKVHEVEAISGAFFLVKKHILDKLGGFDERFFMYGEDLDLCWRIKELNYKIIYYPHFLVIHLKYQSGLGKNDDKIRKRTKYYFYQAMKLFYQKHYQKRYPFFINFLVNALLNYFLQSYEKNRN